MKTFPIVLLAALFLAPSILRSQGVPQPPNSQPNNQQSQSSSEQDGIKGFWECVTSGGKFVARLDQITSLSEHTYLIDGGIRVYECTVGTDGGLIARFYHIEPVTNNSPLTTGKATLDRLKGLANQGTTRTGQGDIDTIVTKHYPDTTHAKTVEFRLKFKDTISRIYNHAHRVWAEERGRGQKNKLTVIDG